MYIKITSYFDCNLKLSREIQKWYFIGISSDEIRKQGDHVCVTIAEQLRRLIGCWQASN